MPSPITITDADLSRPDHAAAVRELLSGYARDPMGGGQSLPAKVLAEVVPALQGHPGTVVLLAWRAGRPAGIAVAFVGLSTFAARPLLNVHDLAVAREERGRGVGAALVEALEAKARLLGCCKITLEVREDNLPAQQLYRRYGFGDSASSAGGRAMWFWTKPLSDA